MNPKFENGFQFEIWPSAKKLKMNLFRSSKKCMTFRPVEKTRIEKNSCIPSARLEAFAWTLLYEK